MHLCCVYEPILNGSHAQHEHQTPCVSCIHKTKRDTTYRRAGIICERLIFAVFTVDKHPRRKLNHQIIKTITFFMSRQSRRHVHTVCTWCCYSTSLRYVCWVLPCLCNLKTVSTSMKSFAVHDLPPFQLWLLPWHSDPLGCLSFACTLVLLQ